MNTHDKIELPPLPEPGEAMSKWAYDEPDIQAYARAAIEADRKRRGEPVNEWLRIRGCCVIASRTHWIYPIATEDDSGPRDEARYAAIGRRDGDIIINGFMGDYDLLDLSVMLSWPTAPQPAEPVKEQP